MAEPVAIQQKEELAAKQKDLAEVLELAGRDLDFSRKPVLERLGAADASDATVKFQALNRAAEALGLEINREEMKAAADAVRRRDEEMKRPVDGPHPSAYDGNERKSWGKRFAESREFKASRQSRTDVPMSMDVEMKVLFQTTAGILPQSTRSGLMVEGVTRPIQVLDLIPSFPISQPSFVYMQETVRTHAAAETGEGLAYPESAFAWVQQTSPVQKIADFIPVTDEQLEDEGQVASLLDQRLSFGLRQRLDSQILVGTGLGVNLRGLNNVVGIQTQALGADSRIVAFLRALTLIRFTGRANPTGAIFHPNDWLDILLTQNAGGDFMFGNPFQGPGPQALFGIPVAQSDAQTQNTGIIADFANFTRIDDRRGVVVQTGYTGTQFTTGQVTLRADMRAAFTVTRPAAVCTLTGI
jgi:HK97 family phage major capsid protein